MMREDDLRALLADRVAHPPDNPFRLAAVRRRVTRIRRRRYAVAAVAALLVGAVVAGPFVANRHNADPAATLRQRTIDGLPEYAHGGRLIAHVVVQPAAFPATSTATLRFTVPDGGLFWGVGCGQNFADYNIAFNGHPTRPWACESAGPAIMATEYPSWERAAKLHDLGLTPGRAATMTVHVRYPQHSPNGPPQPIPFGVWALISPTEYPPPPALPSTPPEPLGFQGIAHPLFTATPMADGVEATVTRTVTMAPRLAVELDCGESPGVLAAAVNGTPVYEMYCWGGGGTTLLLIPIMATRRLHIPAGQPITLTLTARWFTDATWYAAAGPMP